MKVVFFASLFFMLCLLSCSDKKESGIITFSLGKSDYIEKIYVPGTVQAVINVPVMTPSRLYGQMIVVRLAPDGALVKKGDTICVLSSPDLESSYKDLKTSIENLEAGLKRTEADNQLNIALLEAQLATSEAQLKISSLDSLQMSFATEVKKKLLELEMKKALIEKQKIEKKLVATRKIGETEIRQKNARILQEKTRAQSYADQLSSMTMIAQREGVVQRVEAPRFMVSSSRGTGSFGGPIKEGSVLLMASPLLQFPDLSRMQISADVAETDFKKIEKGQKAIITVDAAKKLVTTGKVNRKSLSSSSAQRYTRSKVKLYEVVIDIDSCHTKMKPGLSASCEIIIKEIGDTLFIPTLSIFEKDSSKVVYVKSKKKFIPVKVETGLSGSSYTIITGGLKGNETIALKEPPNSLIVKVTEKIDTTKNHK